MKFKILFATCVVALAACNQQPPPAAQAPEPAITTPVDMSPAPAPMTEKVNDPDLATRDYPSIARGATVSAAAPAEALRPMLISGWAMPEPWGVWSDGTQATLGFKLDGAVDTDLEVTLQLKAFIGVDHPELTVIPTANGRQLAPIIFRGSQAPSAHVIRVPAQDITQADGRVQLDFAIQNPSSPKDFGLSEDARSLGIGLVALSIL